MSECTGADCTHPECADVGILATFPTPGASAPAGFSEGKWSTMNRAERRAAMRGQRRKS